MTKKLMKTTLAALAGAMLLAPVADAAPKKAAAKEPRTIELTVTKKGFEPSPVKVKKGEPLKLVVTRNVERTCATEIVVPGYDISTPLPLGEAVTVTFTPKKDGEIKYGCAMDQMLGGVLLVE